MPFWRIWATAASQTATVGGSVRSDGAPAAARIASRSAKGASGNNSVSALARARLRPVGALMAPAGRALEAELAKVTVKPLAFPVVANVDARPNTDPNRVKDLLVR